MGAMIISLIGTLIWGCIFGVATDKIISNKGYNENWFWWGFFFGFIALIVALTKPEVRYEYTPKRESESALFRAAAMDKRNVKSANTWICGRCGAENQSYTGTCGCGMSKAENEKNIRKQEKERNELENAQKLKAYKDLLDSGAISQEEFDKKKSELLDM